MSQLKYLILACFVSFGSFAKDIKLVNIYKEGELKGSLGVDVDGEGNIKTLYTIDAGVKVNHKISSLRGGLPVVEKFSFDIISVIANDFSASTGGSMTVKYVTHKTGIITLHHAYMKFDLARTEGNWKVYDASGAAVNNFRFKIRKDAKGAEAGIAGVESF
jgi:hypothetical protein